MHTFITHLQVSPENAVEFEALMNDTVAKTRANEPEVAYYGFAKSVKKPNTYVMIEVYPDVRVQRAHLATEWVQASFPVTARLIEGTFDTKQYVTPGVEPLQMLMSVEAD